MTQDGLSESFVSPREPFIDLSGQCFVVLFQAERIFFRPKTGSVGLRRAFVGLLGLCDGLRGPSLGLRWLCVVLRGPFVGLRGLSAGLRAFVGIRGPCLT